MSAQQRKIGEHRGVVIYKAASTHPGALTRSLWAYKGDRQVARVRYKVYGICTEEIAMESIKEEIDEYLKQHA